MGDPLAFLRDNAFHVVPILAAGGFALAIVLERLSSLVFRYPLRETRPFFDKIRDLVMTDRIADAIAFCDSHRKRLAAQVVREALLRAHEPEIMIEDGLELAVTEATSKIQKRTQFLAMLANVSTLLGLFGTIVGLIHSFEAVGSVDAQQRASLLASGISTAMNSTMLGLAVAIPCMVAYSYLMNHVNRLTIEMDQAAVRVLDLIRHRQYAAEAEISRTDPGRKSA